MLAAGLDKLSSIVIIIMFKSVIQSYQDDILLQALTLKKIEHYDMFISHSLRDPLLVREMPHLLVEVSTGEIYNIVHCLQLVTLLHDAVHTTDKN